MSEDATPLTAEMLARTLRYFAGVYQYETVDPRLALVRACNQTAFFLDDQIERAKAEVSA